MCSTRRTRDWRLLGSGRSRGEGRKLARLLNEKAARVRDRSRSMGRKLRAISRTLRRRSGEAKAEVVALTGEAGVLLERSIRGGAPARCAGQAHGEWAWCEAKLESGHPARGARRPVREGHAADQAEGRGRGDQGPDRVVGRSRRPADPQGEARSADAVWLCDAVGGGDREHPAWGAGTDPACVHDTREPGREHAADSPTTSSVSCPE